MVCFHVKNDILHELLYIYLHYLHAVGSSMPPVVRILQEALRLTVERTWSALQRNTCGTQPHNLRGECMMQRNMLWHDDGRYMNERVVSKINFRNPE